MPDFDYPKYLPFYESPAHLGKPRDLFLVPDTGGMRIRPGAPAGAFLFYKTGARAGAGNFTCKTEVGERAESMSRAAPSDTSRETGANRWSCRLVPTAGRWCTRGTPTWGNKVHIRSLRRREKGRVPSQDAPCPRPPRAGGDEDWPLNLHSPPPPYQPLTAVSPQT